MTTPRHQKDTMYLIAAPAIFYWARGRKNLKNRLFKSTHLSVAIGLLAAAVLAGCATPQAPVAKAVYDFGPVQSSSANAAPSLVALALAEVDASTALDGLPVVYRLAYADAQQLRPYALARWSMPPAQLVRTRLRDALAARGPVLGPADGATPWLLKVELDEFSQQFDAPASSSGAVRLHASLFNANKLVAQRTVQAVAPAPSQDAAGGVRAITAATDDAVAQLATWVAEHMR
jgi:cholesterol transport system auxiliary component